MLRHYVLNAWGVFMRRKMFTAINLLCIVLTLVVLMVVTALLEQAFYPRGVEGKSERFLQVFTLNAEGPHMTINGPLGYRIIEKYLKPMRSVEAVAVAGLPQTVAVYQGERVSKVEMRLTDAEYWKVLDFRVLAGRVLSAADIERGSSNLVINASTAKRLFGSGAGTALGRKLSVGGQSFSVVGVVADEMHVNAYADMWAPLTSAPSSDYRKSFNGQFTALLLARSAADLPLIRREVESISATIVHDDPAKITSTRLWADSKLDLFARTLVGSNRRADSGADMLLAAIVIGMLGFMLLPALNLVNLNTGRILERRAEIGVRKAFGATSGQLVRQLIIENLLLCGAGGVLGLAGARLALWWIEGAGLIPYLAVDFNLAVFGWGVLLTFVFGLLSGALPAWKMSRLDPVHALKGAA
ncbi:MAG: transporter permease [Massilia sp.]|nr:transporter permease [Massilia sp.]